jgi:hypothetical protein
MARGGHGLPKVSCGNAMPYPSKSVSGIARLHGGQPVAVFYPFRHPTPYAYGPRDKGSAPTDLFCFSRMSSSIFRSCFQANMVSLHHGFIELGNHFST